jgi:hypothetical protein
MSQQLKHSKKRHGPRQSVLPALPPIGDILAAAKAPPSAPPAPAVEAVETDQPKKGYRIRLDDF